VLRCHTSCCAGAIRKARVIVVRRKSQSPNWMQFRCRQRCECPGTPTVD
jgi:hypothetical protein